MSKRSIAAMVLVAAESALRHAMTVPAVTVSCWQRHERRGRDRWTDSGPVWT